MESGQDLIFRREYFLTPAECNPEGRMPLTLLINRLIEVATLHANDIGIGYATLSTHGHTWVLSRVAVDVSYYPKVNETYIVRTWVSGVSRLFSERDFEICDSSGAPIGYARTVWAALDVEKRCVADISYLAEASRFIPSEKDCPVEKPSRPMPVGEEHKKATYRFKYSDIDFNRHVNSSRYIELLLNQWPLEYHDTYRLSRFEIAYIHEAYFGEEVEVRLKDDGAGIRAELSDAGKPLCRAFLVYTPRES